MEDIDGFNLFDDAFQKDFQEAERKAKEERQRAFQENYRKVQEHYTRGGLFFGGPFGGSSSTVSCNVCHASVEDRPEHTDGHLEWHESAPGI